MKVKNSELIDILKTFPPDMSVFVNDDGEARPPLPYADTVGEAIDGHPFSTDDGGPFYEADDVETGEKTLIL